MDSGANCAIIAEYTINKEKLENAETCRCMLADSTIVTVPRITAHIKSPYFTGRTKCLVFKKPAFGLILGNIPEMQRNINSTENGEQNVQQNTEATQHNINTRYDVTDEGQRGHQSGIIRTDDNFDTAGSPHTDGVKHEDTNTASCNAVKTRGQIRSQEKRPLGVHRTITELNITPDQLSKLQKEEEDFKKLYTQAQEKYTHVTHKKEKISYII